MRLEYGEADLRRRAYSEIVTFAAGDREGVICMTELTQDEPISIDPRSEAWQFRLLASSTVAGDELGVIAFVLMPTTDGSYPEDSPWP